MLVPSDNVCCADSTSTDKILGNREMETQYSHCIHVAFSTFSHSEDLKDPINWDLIKT